jgi:hypothetical protein
MTPLVWIAAGIGIWALLSSNTERPNWTFDEVNAANDRLKQLGVKVIMLGPYEKTASPFVLLQRHALNPPLQLLNDLATAVFTFSDRPREYYRAIGGEWIHDLTIESYVNQRG